MLILSSADNHNTMQITNNLNGVDTSQTHESHTQVAPAQAEYKNMCGIKPCVHTCIRS